MGELNKLQEYLMTNGYYFKRIDKTVPKEMKDIYVKHFGKYSGEGERHQIIVYSDSEGCPDEIWFDVICQWGSYGYDKGLLEISGPTGLCDNHESGVEGWLTAQDIIDRLEDI